jgi:hypothetical protein
LSHPQNYTDTDHDEDEEMEDGENGDDDDDAELDECVPFTDLSLVNVESVLP